MGKGSLQRAGCQEENKEEKEEMIRYKKGYKYQLAEDYTLLVPIKPSYKINSEYIHLIDGVLTIKKGYAWDGCSGPTADDRTNMRGSLVHDALYQLLRMGLLDPPCREIADDLFYRILLEDGMSKLRAKYYHFAVRKFGSPSASPRNIKKLYEAP